MKKYEKILVFDFETSGLDFKNDRVIEIGLSSCKFDKDNFKFIEESNYNEFLKIDFPLSSKITEITGISNEMLKDGKDEKEVSNYLYNILDENTLLIAYNIQFDYNFLVNMIRRNIDSNYQFKSDILDVMIIYKDHFTYPHKLNDAIKKFNIDFVQTHRALDDVRMTIEVLNRLFEKVNIVKYINVLGYNPNYGIKGEKIPNCKYLRQEGNKQEIYKAA